MEVLTRKQKSVFVYIRDFIRNEDHPPSLEEIRGFFKFASTSTADYYVKSLCKKGYLSQEVGKMRTIQVLKNIQTNLHKNISMVSRMVAPILGVANAGEALAVAEEENEGYVEVPATVKNRDKIFALQVDGDSMDKAAVTGKQLIDGSIIFVDPTMTEPEPNDVVLMIINGHATVKKFTVDRKSKQIRLLPVSSNKKHKPIILSFDDDFMVNGKVVGIL